MSQIAIFKNEEAGLCVVMPHVDEIASTSVTVRYCLVRENSCSAGQRQFFIGKVCTCAYL